MTLTNTTTSPKISRENQSPNGTTQVFARSTPASGKKPPQPRLNQTYTNLIFYAIALVAVVIWLAFTANSDAGIQSLRDLFKAENAVVFLGLLVGSIVANFFPFKVPPNLYITLSMVLFFSAFLILPEAPAALVPAVASIIWELFTVKRGTAYAARTAGMYTVAACLARWTYEALHSDTLHPDTWLRGDLSLEMVWPVLAAFLVFRAVNELVVGLTQYLQGYSALAFRGHIFNVTGLYLLFLPASLMLAMLRFNNGPLVFVVGVAMVGLIGYLLNQSTGARENADEQLSLVRDLNNKLSYQNDRQQRLGNRITQTMDSFLTIVRDYAETSHEQEAAVVEITSTIEQLSRTASQIAAAADNVASAAERAIEAADGGQSAVGATIEALSEVGQKVREIAAKIQDLNAKSERIGEIVTVINAIAGEIRLLALNATIEASGAGQFGRRFSIVANEVNQLADRSREALQQIKQIIAEIQMATTSSRRVTEEGLQRMEKSIELASRSELANREIIGVVQKTAQAAAAISLATQQQRSASEQVVTSVHDVAIMIGQNAEKVASVSVASADLQRVARELRAEE